MNLQKKNYELIQLKYSKFKFKFDKYFINMLYFWIYENFEEHNISIFLKKVIKNGLKLSKKMIILLPKYINLTIFVSIFHKILKKQSLNKFNNYKKFNK